jgi:glycosyltransferase involved in cell wall biosynthesis
MRILFLSSLGILGGAERVLLDLFEPLKRALPAATLMMVSGSDGPLIERARSLGVLTTVLPMPSSLASLGSNRATSKHGGALARVTLDAAGAMGDLFRYARDLNRVVHRCRPDVVHSNGIKTHLLTAIAVSRTTPVLWHIHDFLGDRGLLAPVLGLASLRANGAVANSFAVAAEARGILACRPVDVIHNGVDVTVFAPAASSPDGPAWLDPASVRRADVLRIGLIATYARWKGHELFLEAAAILKARRPQLPLRFFIVGGPVYLSAGSQYTEEELRTRVAELGLVDSVVFVPFQNEPAAVYQAMDIVVHASTEREPFGRTIVEGMACGCAVVVANHGGAAELFTDGIDALGYEMGDAQALAGRLDELVGDPALRARLGRAARSSAVERFSAERLGGAFASIYRRLAGQ